MKMMNRAGWILVGALLGVLATTSIRAAGWIPQPAPARLQALNITIAGSYGNAYFLKDTKTGACWLVLPSRDDVNRAVASAPEGACYAR